MKKIILFVLTMLFFHPFAADAETVFDDTQSFQMAKAVRIGRKDDSLSAKTKERKTNGLQKLKKQKKERAEAKAKARKDATEACLNSDDVEACLKEAEGKAERELAEKEKMKISCEAGYFLNTDTNKCLRICDGTICNDGYTTHLVGDRCYCY